MPMATPRWRTTFSALDSLSKDMSAKPWLILVLGEGAREKTRISSSYGSDMPPDLPSYQDAKMKVVNRKCISFLAPCSIVYRVNFQFLQIFPYSGIRP